MPATTTSLRPTAAWRDYVPTHDAQRWGHNWTAEGAELRRLADVIEGACKPGAMQPQGLSLKAAATRIAEALATAPAGCMFQLDAADDPRPMVDPVWREGRPSGVALLEADGWKRTAAGGWWYSNQSDGYVLIGDDLGLWFTDEDLEARGVDQSAVIAHKGYALRNAGCIQLKPEWAAELPELPELRGASGLVQWLQSLSGDALAHELMSGALSMVALTVSAIDALPWLPEASAEVIQFDAGLAVAAADHVWLHKDRSEWSDEKREALFRLRHKDGKDDEALEALTGISRQALNKQIGPKKKKPDEWGDSVSTDWRPSIELLKECGKTAWVANGLQALVNGAA